ncbi:MAG: twin-arginine translocase TatA/TatE family subunit [Ktedonobacteraceae bacterium]|nr:twin-arginine translocase TatA/TatE family subunit [Ktedonobacteraceae bacterium]
MFFGHTWEIIIILVVALLIFGPKKLPEMGSAIGKSIKEFKRGMESLNAPKDIKSEEDEYIPPRYDAIARTSTASELAQANQPLTDTGTAASKATASEENKKTEETKTRAE